MPEYQEDKDQSGTKVAETGLLQTNAEAVPNEEEQVKEILGWVTASDIFPKCRGRIGSWSAVKALQETKPYVHGQPDTPVFESWNSLQKEIEVWRSMENVMVRKLFSLRKQGWVYAHQALLQSLTDPAYVFPGEVVPAEQRQPGVLVMFEPKRCLDLIRWMILLDPEVMINHVIPGYSKSKNPFDRPDLRDWTLQILEENPEFGLAFQLMKTPMVIGDIKHHLPRRLCPRISDWKKRIEQLSGIQYLRISDRNGPDCSFLGNYLCGFFVEDATQDEVLKLFDRDEQEEIATWQFYYPSHIGLSSFTTKIGLIPENLFQPTEKLYPSFSSIGASHGFKGLIIQDKKKVAPELEFYTLRCSKTAQPGEIGIMLHIEADY